MRLFCMLRIAVRNLKDPGVAVFISGPEIKTASTWGWNYY